MILLFPLQRPYAKLEDSDWTLVNEARRPQVVVADNEKRTSKKPNQELQVTMMAKSGIGLSLVCRDPPEELLYAFMSNVVIDFQQTEETVALDGSIQNMQIDNQLSEAQFPVILCLTPATRSDEVSHKTTYKNSVKSNSLNAYRFHEIFLY